MPLTGRIGLEEQSRITTPTLRRRFFALAGRITRSARISTMHMPAYWPWRERFLSALAQAADAAHPGLTTTRVTAGPKACACIGGG